jgi:hypothetical protein
MLDLKGHINQPKIKKGQVWWANETQTVEVDRRWGPYEMIEILEVEKGVVKYVTETIPGMGNVEIEMTIEHFEETFRKKR